LLLLISSIRKEGYATVVVELENSTLYSSRSLI